MSGNATACVPEKRQKRNKQRTAVKQSRRSMLLDRWLRAFSHDDDDKNEETQTVLSTAEYTQLNASLQESLRRYCVVSVYPSGNYMSRRSMAGWYVHCGRVLFSNMVGGGFINGMNSYPSDECEIEFSSPERYSIQLPSYRVSLSFHAERSNIVFYQFPSNDERFRNLFPSSSLALRQPPPTASSFWRPPLSAQQHANTANWITETCWPGLDDLSSMVMHYAFGSRYSFVMTTCQLYNQVIPIRLSHPFRTSENIIHFNTTPADSRLVERRHVYKSNICTLISPDGMFLFGLITRWDTSYHQVQVALLDASAINNNNNNS
jgi:hypothetical protein